MGVRPQRVLLVVALLLILAMPTLPPVAGDGIPAIRYGVAPGEAEKEFSAITESRQLAAVELLNSTHERIDLFLSVYSIDPGKNLTIMVPLRTLPLDVKGRPVIESEFRDDYRIDTAEKKVESQNTDTAKSELGTDIRDDFRFVLGSMLWTMPGEYTREKIVRTTSESSGQNDETLGGGSDSFGEPEPIKHFEFDGFSIDVYNLSAGPKLTEYLAQKGLTIPDSYVLQGYNNHYVAIIESKTKPPMNEREFKDFKENYTKAYDYLMKELRYQPHRSGYEMEDLTWEVQDRIESQYRGNCEFSPEELAQDVVNAFFGDVDFAGEVLEVVLPLDSGKMFFPLGTSAGWPNSVGDIDIMFEVPAEKALDIPGSKDAYIGEKHCYLVQMQDAKPDFDLESSVGSADSSDEFNHKFAGLITENSFAISVIITGLIIVLFWVGLAMLVGNAYKKKNVLKDPALWLMLAGSFFISLPGAFLVYMLVKPVPPGKLSTQVVPVCSCFTYIFVLIFFIVAVVV